MTKNKFKFFVDFFSAILLIFLQKIISIICILIINWTKFNIINNKLNTMKDEFKHVLFTDTEIYHQQIENNKKKLEHNISMYF